VELSSSIDLIAPVLQIVLIDLLLSGDNAILIAMASRQLPQNLQRKAMVWGTVGAVLLRVVLTFLASLLLRAPFLKLTGALFLVMIAIELMRGKEHTDAPARFLGKPVNNIARAMLMIIVADAVMSVDNVVAVAAAAQDQLAFLVFGLLLSIPILVFASVMVARLMDHFPVIVDAGAALLGWVAGHLAVSDPAVSDLLLTQSFALSSLAPLIGAIYVLVQGRLMRQQGGLPHHAPVQASDPMLPRAEPTVAPSVDPMPAQAAVATGKRIATMDMLIMAGAAIPALGLVATILYIVGKAITHH
jgi:YjbE family integral membrane protein